MRWVACSLAVALGIGLMVNLTACRRSAAQTLKSTATLQAQTDGIAVQFAASIDTQQAADVANWSVNVAGSSEPLPIQTVSIGTDDRSVTPRSAGAQTGDAFDRPLPVKPSDGPVLRGALMGTVGN